MTKRLLVLGAGPAQLGLLEAARERGLFVIAVDRDPAAPGFSYADRRAIVSAEDERAVERLADAERVHGIVAPGIDWPVAIAARVAARLRLPHPLAPEAAALATSKLQQRDRFAEAGVPQPGYALCRDLAGARDAARQLGYPCVVKAPDRQGQRGLSRVDDRSALPGAVEQAVDASRSGAFLVEQAISGDEVTVNGFSVAGRFHPLTVTDRLTAEPPAFGVAVAHAWPSSLPESSVRAAVEAAGAAAAAVGVPDGPTYTQVLVANGSAWVGELAARLGGGHDAALCRAALGVDLDGLALAAALGEPVEPARLRGRPGPGGACVRFLVPAEGELRAVTGLDDAVAAEGIVALWVYRKPGDRLGPFRRGADRAGAVLAVGTSRDDALERAQVAGQRIRFVLAEAGQPV